MVTGSSARASSLAGSPGGENDEGRLDELGRLQAENPAARSLHFGAEQQSSDDQRHADREQNQGRAADMARRKKRRRDQQNRAGQQQLGLAINEMKGREAEAFGGGGARRQRHHDADDHQRPERSQKPAIDATQPIGHRATLGSRNHAGAPSICGEASETARCSETSARKRSPRASKLGNWS